jgi:hypothetical protein
VIRVCRRPTAHKRVTKERASLRGSVAPVPEGVVAMAFPGMKVWRKLKRRRSPRIRWRRRPERRVVRETSTPRRNPS